MKIRAYVLSALATAMIFAAPQANAAVINFTGYDYNMGTVAAGNSGLIATSDMGNKHGYFYDFVEGVLPSNTKITFTFNTIPSVFNDNAFSFAEGMSQNSDGAYIYRSWAASDGWFKNERAANNGAWEATPPTFGVQTTATLNKEKTLATVVITNISEVAANFKSYFFSPNTNSSGFVNTSYNVSAVPLPAALPLFGLAVAGFAGYNRRKKKAA